MGYCFPRSGMDSPWAIPSQSHHHHFSRLNATSNRQIPTIQPLGLVRCPLSLGSSARKKKRGAGRSQKEDRGFVGLHSTCRKNRRPPIRLLDLYLVSSITNSISQTHTHTPTPTPPHTLTQPADHHHCVMRGPTLYSSLFDLFGHAECSSNPRLNVAEDRFYQTMRVSKF